MAFKFAGGEIAGPTKRTHVLCEWKCCFELKGKKTKSNNNSNSSSSSVSFSVCVCLRILIALNMKYFIYEQHWRAPVISHHRITSALSVLIVNGLYFIQSTFCLTMLQMLCRAALLSCHIDKTPNISTRYVRALQWNFFFLLFFFRFQWKFVWRQQWTLLLRPIDYGISAKNLCTIKILSVNRCNESLSAEIEIVTWNKNVYKWNGN